MLNKTLIFLTFQILLLTFSTFNIGKSTVSQISPETLYENTRTMQWKHFYDIDTSIYTIKRRQETAERREFYFNTIKLKLIRAGIPEDRAEIYAEIPTVESAWKLNAVSSANAWGMWQIMNTTANRYHFSHDDMRDPVQATKCAIYYISFLDSLFNGDASKVLFAYNGGENNVLLGLKEFQTGNAWYIDFKRRETYDFAPKVLGAWLHQKTLQK